MLLCLIQQATNQMLKNSEILLKLTKFLVLRNLELHLILLENKIHIYIKAQSVMNNTIWTIEETPEMSEVLVLDKLQLEVHMLSKELLNWKPREQSIMSTI